MDENKKQINSHRIIILLLAVLLVLGAIKIGALTDDVKKLKSQNSNLDAEIQCSCTVRKQATENKR